MLYYHIVMVFTAELVLFDDIVMVFTAEIVLCDHIAWFSLLS